jgi:hypothetical protein
MKLAQVITSLRSEGLEDDKLTVEEVLDLFRARVYGPLVMLPALIAVFPVIGALPGVSLAMAMILLIGSIQLAAGLPRPWLPASLKRICLNRQRAEAVLKALEPWAKRFDQVLRPRLVFLFEPPGVHLTGALCVVVALLTLIGALVPGLIVPPALVMILIAFALIANDGFVLILSAVLTAGLVYGTWHGLKRINWPDWLPFVG